MTEFDCRDCGVHVYGFGRDTPPTPLRCATCQWIAEIPSEHRYEVRQRLYDEDAWEHWAKVGSFIDEKFTPRACDHCGKSYQGPAVYCSFACTEVAAA
jgi:hypothetical protein